MIEVINLSNIKRSLCRILVFTLLLGVIDLSWFDLPGSLRVLAATATDVYDAYAELAETAEWADDLSSKLAITTGDSSADTRASADATSFVWGTVGDISTGIYTFNQRNIEATAQVKSGYWLNNTNYEATTGTPTTESVFVTVGGTQWLVDLQYRYMSAPYVRTYTFNVPITANYRYYTLADPKVTSDKYTGGAETSTRYVAQVSVPYDDAPADYAKYECNSLTGFNYAYKYFEGGENDKTLPRTKAVQVSDLSNGSHMLEFYAEDGWDSDNWTNKVASIDTVVAGRNYTMDSSYVSPNVARAILTKQHAYDAIKELIDMWATQLDNYRADQGDYDVNNDGLDQGDDLKDEASWMYTYSGLVRHNTMYDPDSDNRGHAVLGDTYSSDCIWTPAFTSYFYDWDAYLLMDAMDKDTYGAATARPRTMKSLFSDKNAVYSNITSQLKTGYTTTKSIYWKDDISHSFALHLADSPVEGQVLSAISSGNSGPIDAVHGSERNQVDFTFANIIADRVGSNVCIALSDYDNLVAMSAGLADTDSNTPEAYRDTFVDNNMFIVNDMLGSDMRSKQRAYSLEFEGYLEIVYLYYRAVYGLALNYGSLFYYDEARELFEGLPGFPKYNSQSDIDRYNAAVNKNLAALFGHGSIGELTCSVTVPFAVFPLGGDLDGGMEGVVSNGVENVSELTWPILLRNGMLNCEYTYNVRLTVKVSAGGDYTYVYSTSRQKEYATERHEDGSTDDNLPYCDGVDAGTCSGATCPGTYERVDITVLQWVCNKCGKVSNTGEADGHHSGGSCKGSGKVVCPDCNGSKKCPGKHTTLTEEGKWRCQTCGKDAANRSETCTHNCTNCDGTGLVSDNHKVETHYHYTVINDMKAAGCTATDSNHDNRLYYNEYEVSASHMVENKWQYDEQDEDPCGWVSEPRTMHHSQVLRQSFENVQWIDITGYTLWQINNATAKGLAKLLVSPVNISDVNATLWSDNAIVTKAVDKLGYTAYNLNDNFIPVNATIGPRYLGDGTTFNIYTQVNDLERRGRIANSFNPDSDGATFPASGYSLKAPKEEEEVTKLVVTRPIVIAYRKSDCPEMQIGGLVNNDIASFHLTSKGSNSDNLTFTYNPYSQGGRSHTTFNGFVSQALARTLYFTDVVGTYKPYAAYPKIGYGNSIRIQSDYLTLNTLNSTNLTMVGSTYDTWYERGTDVRYCSGKFALVPSGFNELSIYNSSCTWVPARLSVLLGRARISDLYTDSTIDCEADGWIIHTYCHGINGNAHTVWDAFAHADYTNGHDSCRTTESCVGVVSKRGSFCDKGDVNPLKEGTKTINSTCSGLGMMSALSTNKVYSNLYYQEGVSYTIDTSNIVSLAKVLSDNQGYYKYFNDKSYVSVENNAVTIHIPMDYYLNEGMDTVDVASMANDTSITDGMPYVGYQSHGIDDKDIALKADVAHQSGYSVGKGTKFNGYSTFVSGDKTSSRDGGFASYGVDVKGTLTTVANSYCDQTQPDGASAFSSYYPYLFNLNLNRYLPNNHYLTGAVDVNYEQVGRLNSEVKNAPPMHRDQAVDSFSINADFIKGSTTAANTPNRPNDIVIYNPVATESAHVEALSKFLPDATNTGTDATDKRSYSGSYLSSFLEYIKRDTRLAYKYELDNLGTKEQYLSGSGILNQLTKTTTRYHYELKESSSIDTKYYTMEDYNVYTDTNSNTWLTQNMSDVYMVTKTGKYELLHLATSTNYVASVAYLYEGDRISFSEKAHAVVVTPATTYSLEWDDFVRAYKDLQTRTENEIIKNYPESAMSGGLQLTEGMTFGIGPDGWHCRSGALLKLELTFTSDSSASTTPIKDAVEIVVPESIRVQVRSEDNEDSTTYTWYLEAMEDTTLTTLSFNVIKDCFLKAGVTLETEDIVLMCLGPDGTTSEATSITSYDFFYTSVAGSELSATRKSFINTLVVDAKYEMSVAGFTYINAAGFYLGLQSQSSTISLKDEALRDPHKVPNSNWKYYVLGWQTDTGHVILDVNDSVLNDNSTRLMLPNRQSDFADGYVTVGYFNDLANKGLLGVYKSTSGFYGLIDLKNDGTYERRSRYTGYEVTSGYFDTISFGESTTAAYGIVMPTVTNSIYESTEIAKHTYELVFKSTVTDSIAYDVKWSQNIQHKISSLEDNYVNGVGEDWLYVETIVVAFDEDTYKAVFGDIVSLDDEFTIYWDNYGDLASDVSGRSYSQLQSQLGFGWDNLKNSQTKLPIASNWSDIRMSSYWSNKKDVTAVTDTTKWIYNKYLVFNTDMYAFTTGESFVYDDTRGDTQGTYVWDPTTPAYKSDGTPNNIVYIPAGQKVFLGYYNATDSAGDDTGHFIDYGYNIGTKKTSDPNNSPYTYHFWYPLANGESDNNAVVQFVVNAINSVQSGTAGGRAKVKNRIISPNRLAVAIKRTDASNNIIVDEWGNSVYNAAGIQLDNNAMAVKTVTKATTALNTELVQAFAKYNNSINSTTYSSVGRVGGLTVVDSGDPRYQDTFKLAADDADYLISPIVKLIGRYSNVANSEGSQFKYLTDITDVRGRNLVSIENASGYKTSQSGDSYASATWFRSVSHLGNRSILPMTAGFNIHSELVNTLTTTKIGYQLLCSLDTIGNFYGSASKRPAQEDGDYVNNNLDYGQTKIQVHPMYVAYDRDTNKFFAVDVYMRKGSFYALINAGSSYASSAVADTNKDSGPYYLDDAYDATYTSNITTNTGGISGSKYVLDQNMLRYSITETESAITYNVVHQIKSEYTNMAVVNGITSSILDENTYGTEGIGGDGLDYSYIYGNAQMLFLREFNRTFVGGTTLALNEVKGSNGSFQAAIQRNAEMYAQRWYFGLGLPASAVFVRHGQDCHESNILTGNYYILCLVDVYAIGEKWAVHYESVLSGEDLTIDGKVYSSDKWNIYSDTMPAAVPVCMYDLTKSNSSSDMDTHGTH